MHRAAPGKLTRNYLQRKMALTAFRPGMSGMQVTFVCDYDLTAWKAALKGFPNRCDAIPAHVLVSTGDSSPALSRSMCFERNSICITANASVSGRKPNTLNAAQCSVCISSGRSDP